MELFLFIAVCMALVAMALAAYCAISLRLLVEQFTKGE